MSRGDDRLVIEISHETDGRTIFFVTAFHDGGEVACGGTYDLDAALEMASAMITGNLGVQFSE